MEYVKNRGGRPKGTGKPKSRGFVISQRAPIKYKADLYKMFHKKTFTEDYEFVKNLGLFSREAAIGKEAHQQLLEEERKEGIFDWDNDKPLHQNSICIFCGEKSFAMRKDFWKLHRGKCQLPHIRDTAIYLPTANKKEMENIGNIARYNNKVQIIWGNDGQGRQGMLLKNEVEAKRIWDMVIKERKFVRDIVLTEKVEWGSGESKKKWTKLCTAKINKDPLSEIQDILEGIKDDDERSDMDTEQDVPQEDM